MASTECVGVCVYGDDGVRVYPDPLNYDGSRCGCRRCCNFEVCRKWTPREDREWCGDCTFCFAKKLQFADKQEECVVCREQKSRFVGHPAECGHETCVECLREAFFWEPDSLDPREYGFHTDCRCSYCSDASSMPCDKEMNRWESEDPAAYEIYDDDNDRHTTADERARYDMRTCPLCRAHVADASSNSWPMPR